MAEQIRFKHLAQRFPNRTALITGGASGLGAALTSHLLHDGWQVHAIDKNIEPFQKNKHTSLFYYQLDITDTNAYKTLLDTILEKTQIDILFNNAGLGEGCRFEHYSPENWKWMIDINLVSVIVGTHHLLSHFRQKRSGMIVNIASAAGYANLPKMSPYNVTKAAVISLSESLANELHGSGISVKCVTPTFFRSKILQHSRGEREVLDKAQNIVGSAKLSSDDSALLILSRLHSNSETIRFPVSARYLYFLKHYLPSLFKWGVRKFLVKG